MSQNIKFFQPLSILFLSHKLRLINSDMTVVFSSCTHEKNTLLIFSTALWHLSWKRLTGSQWNSSLIYFYCASMAKQEIYTSHCRKKRKIWHSWNKLKEFNRKQKQKVEGMLEKEIKWRYQTWWQLCSPFKKRLRISLKNISWDSFLCSTVVIMIKWWCR